MASLIKVGTLCLRPTAYSTGVLRNTTYQTSKTFKPVVHWTINNYNHILAGQCTKCSHLGLSKESLYITLCRYFKTKAKSVKEGKKLLPFEQARYVEKDTLLYERPLGIFWNFLGGIGGAMCLVMWFWAYNQWFIVEALQTPEDSRTTAKRKDNWYAAFTRDWKYFKYLSSTICVLVGFGVLSLSLIYPVRMVQKLELLKGGDTLKVLTYGHIVRSKQYIIPMDKVSCAVDRQMAKPYVRMMVSGKRFGFLLNKQIGTFRQPELFDRAIGSVKTN